MNNRIYIKRSNVPNKVPTSADIDLGELALNTADVKLYASGTTANSILQIGWDRVSRTGDTLTGDFNINGSITANTFVKSGGTSSQFLKADGSVDSTVYLSGETDTLQSVTTRGSATTTSILANAFIKSGGTNQQFLLADGSVTTASAITVTFTGTTNFLQKLNTSSGLTNSLIYDNGTALGIATTNVTDYTVTIGNQSDRSIGIESNSNGDGKSLTIAGGTGIGTGTGTTFTQIASIFLRSLAFAPNGDVYGSGNSNNVYKQTGGVGAFAIVGSIGGGGFSRGCTVAPNGDVYVSRNTGDIYKQTGGVGAFVALGQTSRDWNGMAAAANGDIYCCVSAGDIYKQTGGVGNFIALGQTSRAWQQMCEFNGDIYACGFTAGIFKQTGGVGNFVSIGIQAGRWIAIGTSNGDLYAGSDDNDDLFKQTGGVGAFVPINTGFNPQVAIAGQGTKLYFVDSSSAVVEVNQFINFNGGKLKLEAGAGSGSGTTSIEFNLPITNTGTTQTKSTLMSLANNGDLTLTGRYIKSGGASTEFLKADGSVDNSVYITAYTETDTLQSVTTRGAITTTNITANSFIKSGGLSTQFLKANGSVDSNTYLTTETDTLQSVTNRGNTTTTNITANAFIKAGGTSNQFLMADGSVSLGGGGSVSFTGTTNYIQKLDASSAMTNSLIHDNGIGLGIGTTAFTTTATTIQFGNQVDRKVTIEPKLSGIGKTLIVQGGNGIDGTIISGGNSEVFTIIDNTSKIGRGITIAPNGDVYASAFNSDIYKQTGGVGSFVALGQTARQWFGMASAPNGDIYAGTFNSGIYKQTGGVGDFISIGEISRTYFYMTVTSNNDIYVCVENDDIYKQTNSTGAFVGLGQADRLWRGVCQMGNDMYATVENDGIYKQTNGVGDFNLIYSNPSKAWQAITSIENTLYASSNDDVYKSINNGVTFTALNTGLPFNNVFGISGRNGKLAVSGNNYIATSPASSTILAGGGTLKLIGGDTTDTTVTTAQIDTFSFFQAGNGGWRQMTTAPNGDIYTIDVNSNTVWKKTAAGSSFTTTTSIGQQLNGSVTITANGTVYVPTNGGIYISTNGGTSWNTTAFGTFAFLTMGYRTASNDVYGAISGGDIYKQTNSTGSFVALGQTARAWRGLLELNGDMYAVENNGDLYKQTGGVGNFVAQGLTSYPFWDMTTLNGHLYGADISGQVRKRVNNSGNWVSIGGVSRGYIGITYSNTGELYATVNDENFYVSPVSTVSDNFSGGSVSIETGVGYGNASNSIDFVTSTPIASAAGIQTKSTKMQILGNGYIKMTSIPTFADNASALAGGLSIGTLYKTSGGDLMIVI